MRCPSLTAAAAYGFGSSAPSGETWASKPSRRAIGGDASKAVAEDADARRDTPRVAGGWAGGCERRGCTTAEADARREAPPKPPLVTGTVDRGAEAEASEGGACAVAGAAAAGGARAAVRRSCSSV